jgi:predicted SAM-dependent methyltransferase
MTATATGSTNQRLRDQFGQYLGQHVLNVGCASNYEEGCDNLDLDARVNPDIVARLGDKLPIADNTYDTIVASHCLEHVPPDDLWAAFNEMHRVLKPKGFLVAMTPYGSTDDAWDNPHHRQKFTENTYMYFSKRLYEVQHSGYHAWEGQDYSDWIIVDMRLIPFPEFQNDPELDFKKRHYRNVIQELQVVMQAVK